MFSLIGKPRQSSSGPPPPPRFDRFAAWRRDHTCSPMLHRSTNCVRRQADDEEIKVEERSVCNECPAYYGNYNVSKIHKCPTRSSIHSPSSCTLSAPINCGAGTSPAKKPTVSSKTVPKIDVPLWSHRRRTLPERYPWPVLRLFAKHFMHVKEIFFLVSAACK